MKRGWVVGVALGLSLWCGLARAECTKDIECKGDRICREGVCADAGPSPAPVASELAAKQEAPPPQVYRRRSTGMMVTGIVLTSAGAAALAGGVALGIMASSCRSDLEERYPDRVLPASAVEELGSCNKNGTRSTILLLASLPLVGTGIPLWAVGARRVPVARAMLGPWLTSRAGGVSFVITM